MKRNTIFSIGILIAFFLPWIDLTFFTLSGYNIPTSLDKLSNLGKAFDKSDNSNILKLSYLLYLIPICSAFNIFKDIKGIKGSYFLNEFRLGILSVIILFIVVNNINEKATSVLSIGYYLTALFSVLGIFSYGNSKSEEKQVFQNKEEPKETAPISSEKTDLLNQLSQLHSLKEKGILTEDIYEEERLSILNQLKKLNTNESIEPLIIAEVENKSVIEERNPEYEQLFGKETWFKKNKTGLIISTIVISISIAVFVFVSTTNSSYITNTSLLGKWQFEKSEIFPSTANFSAFEKIDQKASRLTFTFIDTTNVVITERLNLDKKWGKTKLETYNYVFKVSQDSILQLYPKTTEVSMEKPLEFPIIKVDSKFLILKISPAVNYSRKEGDYFHYTFKLVPKEVD